MSSNYMVLEASSAYKLSEKVNEWVGEYGYEAVGSVSVSSGGLFSEDVYAQAVIKTIK